MKSQLIIAKVISYLQHDSQLAETSPETQEMEPGPHNILQAII